MRTSSLASLCASFAFALSTPNLMAAVDYAAIGAQGVIVTGVRSDSATTDSVVITASYTPAGSTTASLYNGSLAAAPGAPLASWNLLNPVFPGQTVTSSTFYGPNTPRFDSSIPAGQVVAVGSYKYNEGASGPGFDHGMLYQGTVTGTGSWTQLDATPLVTSGTLLNTIAHSTMSQLVVGNYDTSITTGKAFIYNRATDSWTDLNPFGSMSVTAYGIWQNSSNSYTIAGGYSDITSFGLDVGYLVNYNSDTGELTNPKSFHYANDPVSSLITHIDGITATEGGFNLTGDYLAAGEGGAVGAFFAHVPVNIDGSFGVATWTDIAFPDPAVISTSGNTVIDDSVLGIFVTPEGTRSYIATVPEPGSGLLGLLAVGLVGVRGVRRRPGVESRA